MRSYSKTIQIRQFICYGITILVNKNIGSITPVKTFQSIPIRVNNNNIMYLFVF